MAKPHSRRWSTPASSPPTSTASPSPARPGDDGARQRCRMRACSSGSQFRTPDFDQDDRLAALGGELCDFEKLVGRFEAFDKAGNDSSIRIIQQIAGEIGKVEVGLVPCRDDVAEAEGATVY